MKKTERTQRLSNITEGIYIMRGSKKEEAKDTGTMALLLNIPIFFLLLTMTSEPPPLPLVNKTLVYTTYLFTLPSEKNSLICAFMYSYQCAMSRSETSRIYTFIFGKTKNCLWHTNCRLAL